MKPPSAPPPTLSAAIDCVVMPSSRASLLMSLIDLAPSTAMLCSFMVKPIAAAPAARKPPASRPRPIGPAMRSPPNAAEPPTPLIMLAKDAVAAWTAATAPA